MQMRTHATNMKTVVACAYYLKLVKIIQIHIFLTSCYSKQMSIYSVFDFQMKSTHITSLFYWRPLLLVFCKLLVRGKMHHKLDK